MDPFSDSHSGTIHRETSCLGSQVRPSEIASCLYDVCLADKFNVVSPHVRWWKNRCSIGNDELEDVQI